MKRVSTASKWKRALVATLCAFTLAFSMMGVAWADLAPGQQSDDQLSTQDAWSYKVYLQYGDGPEVLVKTYDATEFAALASTSGTRPAVSGLHYKKGVWKVATAATYVTLDEILENANLDGYWKSGSTMYVAFSSKKDDGTYTDPAFSNEKGVYPYDVYSQTTYFYPETDSSSASNAHPVAAPLVFALTGKTGTTIDGATYATAQDAAEKNVLDAAANNDSAGQNKELGTVVVGSLESDIVDKDKWGSGTTAGNRLINGTTALKIVIPEAEESDEPTIGSSAMHRLYNPYSGEHFFTSSDKEQADLVKAGWTDEKDGWTAPQYSDTPVYRLYNSYAGEHHYTTSAAELTSLVKAGWNYEGIGWYSDDSKGVKVYRVYNPNEFANNHHYTTSESEAKGLIDLGWKDEGVAFYGVA